MSNSDKVVSGKDVPHSLHILDVSLVDCEIGVSHVGSEIGALDGRVVEVVKVVDDNDLPASLGQKGLDEMAADEARTAGDEDRPSGSGVAKSCDDRHFGIDSIVLQWSEGEILCLLLGIKVRDGEVPPWVVAKEEGALRHYPATICRYNYPFLKSQPLCLSKMSFASNLPVNRDKSYPRCWSGKGCKSLKIDATKEG